MEKGKIDACGDLKSCERLSSNAHGCVPPPNTTVTRETEIAKLTSPGPREYAITKRSPERKFLNSQNSNSVGILKDAEGGSLNYRDFFQRQITNHSTTTSYPLKLAMKFRLPPKVPQRESCIAPGTGVYYTSRRSVTSKGYGKVCVVEALSLLADVSCSLKRSHQQSSTSTSKISKNVAEFKRFNQGQWDRPRKKKMASAEKSGSHPYCKEPSNQKSSKKIPLLAKENSYKVVRKHRTPRKTSKPMLHCPNRIQMNKSLSMCDEYSSRIGESSSMTDTNHICESLVKSDASAICSEEIEENFLGEAMFSDDKSGTNILQVTQAVQKVVTLERVSKVLHQLCSTKKETSRGFKRVERFTHQILRFIGEAAVPEKLIRQALGNNPDTSKALRLLLTERKVMRFNSGGRGQAYEYAATEKGLHQLHDLVQEVTEAVELIPEHSRASSWSSAAGALIVPGARNSEVQCFPIEDHRNWKAQAAADPHESRPSSVTPHCSFKFPGHYLNCVTSTELFDLQSSEVTEC